MKVLDYDKIDALLGLEYNGEEIDTFESLEKQVINAIPIPDNATNGDIIKAMFPNLKGREKTFEINVTVNINPIGTFTVDWWNAPYKGVE